MGVRLERLKRYQAMSGPEILAGLILDQCINRDGLVKLTYFNFPFWVEYVPEEGPRLDCLYLQNERSFMLLNFMKNKPDYQQILAVAPQILEWLAGVFATCAPPEPERPKRRGSRRRRVANRQQIAQTSQMLPQNTQKATRNRN